MPLETANYVYDLNPSNPPGTDVVQQGDDHLRMIKQVLQNTFTNVTGPEVPNTGGTIGAWTVQYSYAPASYSNGQTILFVAAQPNVGPITISVNGGAPIPVYNNNAPLEGLEFEPGSLYALAYYNGVFNIMYSSSQSGGVTSFNTRKGDIVLTSGDITGAGGALSTQLANYLPLAGGTLSNPNSNQLIIDKPASGLSSNIFGTRFQVNRWLIQLGDSTAESISNIGSNFNISRYTDTGTLIDSPLNINRQTGNVTVSTIMQLTGGIVLINPTANMSTYLSVSAPTGMTASIYLNPAGGSQWQIQSDAIGNLNFMNMSAGGLLAFSINPAGMVSIPNLAGYLPLSGGALTGALTVGTTLGVGTNLTVGGVTTLQGSLNVNPQTGNSAIIAVTKPASVGTSSIIMGYRTTLPRWAVYLANADAESSGNSGSNFQIQRFTDIGGNLDYPLTISRATGVAAFLYSPTAPTPAPGDNSTNLATTAFVQSMLGGAGVTSFNGRSGAVTLVPADISGANGALITDLAGYLPLTGGTLTGQLNIQSTTTGVLSVKGSGNTIMSYDKVGSGNTINFSSYTAGVLRWNMALGDGGVESGSNAGSNIIFTRYSDTGTNLGTALALNRASAAATLGGTVLVQGQNINVQPSTAPSAALLYLSKSGSGQVSAIYGRNATLLRWAFQLGDGAAESTGNVGSNFSIQRYDDTGTVIDTPISISRANGIVTMTQNLNVSGGTTTIGSNTSVGSTIIMNKAQNTLTQISSRVANVARWLLILGDANPESGNNAGCNFSLQRYSDAGTLLDNPITINRANGIVTFSQSPVVPTPPQADNSQSAATTAYINTALANLRWNGTFA